MITYQPLLLLGPNDHGRALTAKEFAEAEYVEPWKYEREAGRLIVMPPDGPGHDRGSEPIRDHLGPIAMGDRGNDSVPTEIRL
jgi:Uma2 family endonuclease